MRQHNETTMKYSGEFRNFINDFGFQYYQNDIDKTIDQFFENDIDLNIQIGLKRSTLLMVAVTAKSVKFVKRLIDAGVDLDIQNEYGNTALLLSLYIYKKSNMAFPELKIIQKELILAGANLDICNEYEQTALILSSRILNHHDTTKLLIKHGANVNARDYVGITAMYNVIKYFTKHSFDICKLLVEHGAKINETYKRESYIYLLTYERYLWKDKCKLIKYLTDNGLEMKLSSLSETMIDKIYETEKEKRISSNKTLLCYLDLPIYSDVVKYIIKPLVT